METGELRQVLGAPQIGFVNGYEFPNEESALMGSGLDIVIEATTRQEQTLNRATSATSTTTITEVHQQPSAPNQNDSNIRGQQHLRKLLRE